MMVFQSDPRLSGHSLGHSRKGVGELALVACSGALGGQLDRGVPLVLTWLLCLLRLLGRWLQLGVLLAPEAAGVAEQGGAPAPPRGRLCCPTLLTLQQHLAVRTLGHPMWQHNALCARR